MGTKLETSIPPRPAEPEPQVVFPLRYWGRQEIMPWLVVGDSMAPTILDHDLLFTDVGLLPSPHDIVVVPFTGRLDLPGVNTLVARTFEARNFRVFPPVESGT